MPIVQAASHLLILDAIDAGLAPGELAVFADDAVPAYLTAKKMSLHQTGFAEVLALAELSGQSPCRLALVGVQPVELEDYGGSLRPCVKAALESALTIAVERLAAWGAAPRRRLCLARHGEGFRHHAPALWRLALAAAGGAGAAAADAGAPR